MGNNTMSKIYQPTPQQIEAWVGKHFDYKPRKNGTELRICNPFDPDGDGKYYFNISTLKGACHDWHGDDIWAGPINPRTGKRQCTFLNFVKLYLNCSYRQAVLAVSLASGSDVPSINIASHSTGVDGHSGPTERPLVTLPDGSELLDKSTQKTTAKLVYTWLQSRGVSAKLATLCNIYHLGADVIFPYYEYGQLVYWQTRSAMNKRFNFPSEEQFDVGKGQFIYNFDNIEPASYIIVVEAIFGCLTLGEQCSATVGADMTGMQMKKIKLLGPRDGVILAPDNDYAGIKSIIRNGNLLSTHGESVLFSIPPAMPYVDADGSKRTTKDWNELYTKLHMPLADIRKVFEDNIRPLNESTRFKLPLLGKEVKTATMRLPKI